MWLTFRFLDTAFNRFEKAVSQFDDFPKAEDSNYEYSQEKIESQSSITTKEVWKSANGSIQFSRVTTQPKKKELSKQEIKDQIKKAVELEDYEQAARLKKMMKGE